MAFAKLFIPRKNYLRGHDGKQLPRDAFADELANYLAIERWANGLVQGASQRYATVVVAASDSLHHTKADADFVCTGTTDETTILSAVNSLPSMGGKVLLMEGHYNFNTVLGVTGSILALPSNVTLEGMGNGTIITYPNSYVPNQIPWLIGTAINAIRVNVVNICFDCNASGNGHALGALLIQGGTGMKVTGCSFVNGLTGVGHVQVSTAGGIGTNELVFVGNYFSGTILNITDGAGRAYRSVFGYNVFNGGGLAGAAISLNGVADTVVTGNRIYNYVGTTAYGIYANACTGILIEDNHISNCQTGIVIDGATNESKFSGNRIYTCQQQGCLMTASGTDNAFTDNFIFGCSQQTANTFDGIANTGSATCSIMGNVIRGNSHRDAINNAGNNNTIVNNDLHGGYTTAAFVDSGAGTVKNLDGSANNWNRT